MSWSRREVLRALGVGAAVPGLAPLVTACGGAPRRARGVGLGARPIEALRAELRQRVIELSREYRDVTALASVHRRGGAAADGRERGADVHREAALVLGITAAGERHEQATTDLSSAGIDVAVSLLRTRADRDPRAREVELAAPVTDAVPLARDPAAQPPRDWLRRIDALLARGQRVGGSRIVYRGAYVTVDDATTLFIGRGRDRSQRLVRTRAGVLMVAWTGSAPSADEAGHAGTIGLEALDVDGGALEAAAERALSLLTARAAPEGETAVILAPELTALLATDGLAPMLSAAAWHTRASSARADHILGASGLSITDDPRLAGGYGSYYFDDDGDDAAPLVLVDGGAVAAPYRDRAHARALSLEPSGHGRRPSPLEPIAPAISNLRIGAGGTPLGELYAAVDKGLLLEGAESVRVDPRDGRLVLRATRARGIAGGKLSGALYGAVELRTTLAALLGDAVFGAELGPYRPHPRGALPASAAGPHLASRGVVRRG